MAGRLNEANGWVARVDLGSSVFSYMVLGQLVPSATPGYVVEYVANAACLRKSG
jgi:hypothetical protein